MNKVEFKNKILSWLKENAIDISGKRIRTYNTRRYGLEMRIYNEPIEWTNTRKSRRMMTPDEQGNNCTFGIHSRMVSTYTHINEEDFKSEVEKEFILEMLRSCRRFIISIRFSRAYEQKRKRRTLHQKNDGTANNLEKSCKHKRLRKYG